MQIGLEIQAIGVQQQAMCLSLENRLILGLMDVFGLPHPEVCSLVQKLPGAELCKISDLNYLSLDVAKSGASEGFQTIRMELVLLVDADKGLMQLNSPSSSLLVVGPLRCVWQLKGPQNL